MMTHFIFKVCRSFSLLDSFMSKNNLNKIIIHSKAWYYRDIHNTLFLVYNGVISSPRFYDPIQTILLSLFDYNSP